MSLFYPFDMLGIIALIGSKIWETPYILFNFLTPKLSNAHNGLLPPCLKNLDVGMFH